MRKTLTTLLVGLVAMPAAISAQVRIERPITIQTTLQIQPAVVAKYDSLDNYLQPTAREKLALSSAMLQKEVAGSTAPDTIVAHARAEVTRQFPRMTQAQQDRMVFLALTAALQADKDAMGDMGDVMSLKMQMYMDRRSKLMSTLSNLLKKMSETSDGIVSNLK